MTVRQVYRQLETAGIVAGIDGAISPGAAADRLRMRRDGLLAWGFVADGTRLQRKPDSHADADGYLDEVVRTYRRDLWQQQDVRIEDFNQTSTVRSLRRPSSTRPAAGTSR